MKDLVTSDVPSQRLVEPSGIASREGLSREAEDLELLEAYWGKDAGGEKNVPTTQEKETKKGASRIPWLDRRLQT